MPGIATVTRLAENVRLPGRASLGWSFAGFFFFIYIGFELYRP